PARPRRGSRTAPRSAVHQPRVSGPGSFSTIHRENLCDRPQPGSQGNAGGLPMSIENRRQLENTHTKLQELEQLYAKTEQGPATDEHVRELTLRSLKRRMNQFKEEIARFEARVSQGTPNG